MEYDEINPDGTEGDMGFEVTMSCMHCGRGIRSWFHGTGAICDQCAKKGITRQNSCRSILDVFTTAKSDVEYRVG